MRAAADPRSLPSVVYDNAGLPVDVSGPRWRLNDVTGRTLIDWEIFPKCSNDVLLSCKRYLMALIVSRGPLHVKNTFDNVRYALSHVNLLPRDGSEPLLSKNFFAELHKSFGTNAWQLHHVRQWYCWAADQGYPSVCPDVAFEIARMRVGGNSKGRAVLSQSPTDGPLDDLEVATLLNALRDPIRSASLTKAERAAVWLCIAVGPNPLQPALMRDEDVLEVSDGATDEAFVHVMIPRMKKGGATRRESFRRRGLTKEIGEIMLALVRENEDRRRANPALRGFARALFSREKPSSMTGGAMEEYALHILPQEFTGLLERAIAKLDVQSHRTGTSLRVTTRRLRYTFATRLIREGASKREVADQLDHTDLQNVQTYFDVKSDIVGPLDKALAVTLGPIAQAFMGKLVKGEDKAERGDDPRSRVAVPDEDVMRPVGTCGSYGFCGLMAPVACYTCSSFQPWMDAPHHLLLERLLADRDRKTAAGRDGRMVSLLDDTILAIGDVISRIEAVAAQ